jgi:hypothetical protein
MEQFELGLDEDYLIAIGRITVNFETLEQIVSFFIWNLIEFDEVFKNILIDASKTTPSLERSWIEYFISTRSGLEKGYGTKLGQIVTAELSFSQKINLLSSICRDKLKNLNELDEVDQILKRVALAEQKRNTVVHSFWTGYPGFSKVARIKTTAKRKSKGLKLEIENPSLKELEEVATYITNIAYDIQTLVIRLYVPNFKE